jgi:hypothetical protein
MLTFDDYITDVLMRDLVGHDRRPTSFLMYLWLAAEQSRRAGPVRISYQELAEATGVSKSSAQAAIGWLVRRKLLAASKDTATAIPVYTVHQPWNESVRDGAAPGGHSSRSIEKESGKREGPPIRR